MAWTHNIIGTESTGERLRVLVDYTDGGTTVHGEHFTNCASADLNWLKGEIVRKIAELDGLSALAASIPTGVIDLTLPTPPTPEEPPLPIVRSVVSNESGVAIMSVDGKPMFAPSASIDPTSMCFCQGVAGAVSVETPYIEWQNSYPSVQLQGMTLLVTGAEPYDKLDFEIGLYVPGWYSISKYGQDITLIEPRFEFTRESSVRSNPIPQGLVFKIKMTFANPATENQPNISAIYHLWRPT